MRDEYITNSEQETFDWAKNIGLSAKKGSVYAVRGQLGAGKTVIAKGIAQGLGIKDDITSPTFLLLEEYPEIPFYHFDLYRIMNPEELDNLCFEEYWESAGISVVEWPERAGDRLPLDAIRIDIERIDDNKRRIVIEYSGN